MRSPPNARHIAMRAISGSRPIGGRRRCAGLSATASAAQRGNVGGITRRPAFEYRGTGNQHVRAGIDRLPRGLWRDAAIDLERDLATGFGDARGDGLDLPELTRDESLSAKTRIDAHHEHQIDEIKQI